MKYAKFIIVITVLLAIIIGVVVISSTQKADDVIVIQPSTEKEQTVKKDIQDKIIDAPNSKFCTKEYDDIFNAIDLFFQNEPTNKKTYTNELQYAYTDKFVKQAMYVFDRNDWRDSDIRTIKDEYKRCIGFSPDNVDLKSINSILNEYNKLKDYNTAVSNACRQRPNCNNLYVEDNWDLEKTNYLINNIPSADTKAKNSPVYKTTRKDKVEERLKIAHKKFIDDKMNCAEMEAKGYNYDPLKHDSWEEMVSKLYVNFKTYNKKWNEDVSAWQRRAASWEQYTISRNPTIY